MAAAAFATMVVHAHKPITSKYTYNDDVFPIFRERCARCHVTGGVAPMSLMTYEEAFPWAESIRAELVGAHMPPASADSGFGAIKRAHMLSPRELDIVLTWASGGNPRGALDQKLPAVTLKNEWALGQPDLALQAPGEFALAADKMEDSYEFTVATRTTEPRWVRAVDLLPGTPSIVRSAVIAVKESPERVLARWLPGQDPEPLDNGAAFRLPAGAELVARVHYKKTWQFEGKALGDRSTIGVYFAGQKDAREVTTLPVTSGQVPAGKHQTFRFAQTIDENVQALALSPDRVPDNVTLQVEAVRPDGSRAALVRFTTMTNWSRRYWFEKPIALPRGSRIEVVARTEDPDLVSAAFGGPSTPASAAGPATVTLALDVVAMP